MSGRKHKTDSNHAEIRDGLRSVPGCQVFDLSHVGGGVPDLLVSFRGKLVLLEVKDGKKSPSRRRLTDDETDFHRRFGEHVEVVLSLDEALRAVGVKLEAA